MSAKKLDPGGKAKSEPTVNLTFRLPAGLRDEAVRLSGIEDETISRVLRKALREWVAGHKAEEERKQRAMDSYAAWNKGLRGE